MTSRAKLLIVTIFVGAGIAGWWVAHLRHREPVFTEQDLAVQRQTSEVVSWVSGVLASADHLVLRFPKRSFDVRDDLKDRKVLASLVSALRSSTYEKTAHALWVSELTFELYCDNRMLAAFQQLGAVVRIMGTPVDGDYIVSGSLPGLLQELGMHPEANQSLEPTTTSVTSPAGAGAAPAAAVAHP